MDAAENPAYGQADAVPTPVADPVEHHLAQADEAQRTLAGIWSGQPDGVGAPSASTANAGAMGPAAADATPRRLPGASGGTQELIVQLSQELTERSQRFGSDDPRTLDARLDLGAAYLEAGEPAAAIPLLEAGTERLGESPGRDAARLLAAKAVLARAYLMARRPQQAIGLFNALLSDTAGSVSESERWAHRIRLATAHRATGDVAAAIDQLDALVAELAGLENAREHRLEALVELSTSHIVAGRPAEGAPVCETALRLAEQLYGSGHRTTLGVRLLLVRAHQQAGQTARAIRDYERLLDDAEHALGAQDRLTIQAHRELTALLSARR